MIPQAGNEQLESEARVLARYLIGSAPAVHHVSRYVAADRQGSDDVDPSQERTCAFVRRHPWAAGPLDTASALLKPDSRLRSKVLRMAAILEASPDFARRFLPQRRSRFRIFTKLLGIGVSTALQFAIGVPLL